MSRYTECKLFCIIILIEKFNLWFSFSDTNSFKFSKCQDKSFTISEDGGEIGGSGVHFPSTPVKYLADMRSRVNSHGIPAYMKIGDQR